MNQKEIVGQIVRYKRKRTKVVKIKWQILCNSQVISNYPILTMFYGADEISVVEYLCVLHSYRCSSSRSYFYGSLYYFIMTNQLIDQYYCVA